MTDDERLRDIITLVVEMARERIRPVKESETTRHEAGLTLEFTDAFTRLAEPRGEADNPKRKEVMPIAGDTPLSHPVDTSPRSARTLGGASVQPATVQQIAGVAALPPDSQAAKSSADMQQRRGAFADIIAEALNSYREYMLDDDFDAPAALNRIMEKMQARYSLYDSPVPDPAAVEWQHVKRGTTYREIGLASLQCSGGCGEDAVLVIYQGVDGKIWARPHDEFHDGRFGRRHAGEAA